MRKRRHRLTALLLVLLLLLGTAACRPPAPEEGWKIAESGEALHAALLHSLRPAPPRLSAIALTPPDMAALEAALGAEREALRRAHSFGGSLAPMMRAKRLLDEFDTNYVLSELYYNLDRSDEAALARLQAYQEHYGQSLLWWDEIDRLVKQSAHEARLRPLWNPMEQPPFQQSTRPVYAAHLEGRIWEIAAAAETLLEEETVSYLGKRLDLSGCFDQEDWEAACAAWLEAHGQTLLAHYTELVALRGELARDCYGAARFSDYIFREYGWEYSPEMAETLAEGLIEHLLPLDQALTRHGYWDELYGGELKFARFLSRARPVLEEMDARMAQAFDLLLGYELWLHEGTPDSYERPYATYLPLYHVAVILCPYDQTRRSILNFSHEFGHFYEYYRSLDTYSRQNDLSELHAQAMTLLFCEVYAQRYGEPLIASLALVDLVDSLVYQSFNCAIELAVYALPEEEIDSAQILAIGREVSARFGYDGGQEALENYQWLLDAELFTAPFAPFSYVSSAAAALELWEIAQEDLPRALTLYDQLVCHAQVEDLMGNLRLAGLRSPFAADFAQQAAARLERYFFGEAAA